MSIGSTIKTLRRAKNMTQEDLAGYLGISPKAISQWECDRTAPDISMIAPLTSIFDVTADTLLGIDIYSKDKQIDKLYDEAYAMAESGEHSKAIELAEKALMQHPSSYKLMDFYANEIFLYNDILPKNESDREKNRDRALQYIDKVLNECTDSSVRNNCFSMACLWYPAVGRTEEAERLARTLDGAMWTCGELLSRIYTGQKQFETLRDEQLRQFTSAIGDLLGNLRVTCNDDGRLIYSEEEMLRLNQMCVDMFALYFPDGDYFYHSRYVKDAYQRMADIYASRHNEVKTLECLQAAAEFAIHFDKTSPDDIHTSPAVKGMVAGDVWCQDEHNACYHLLNKFLSGDNAYLYDFVRNTKEYKDILTNLRAVAN